MNIGIVVGKNYRGLESVKNYITRLKPGHVIYIFNGFGHKALFLHTLLLRLGRPFDVVVRVGDDDLAYANQRVSMVKTVDKIVLFDDGSPEFEHLRLLAEVNKKRVVQFREV